MYTLPDRIHEYIRNPAFETLEIPVMLRALTSSVNQLQ